MSLLDTQIAVMANVSSAYLCSGEVPRRWGNASPIIVPYQTFPTSDGWMIVASGNDSQFRHVVTAGGEPQLADDARFLTNPDRVMHRKQLIPLLEVMTRKKNEQVIARNVQIDVPRPPWLTVGVERPLPSQSPCKT